MELTEEESRDEFAEFHRIDSHALLKELEEIEPDEAMAQKWGILNWVVFWHSLKSARGRPVARARPLVN